MEGLFKKTFTIKLVWVLIILFVIVSVNMFLFFKLYLDYSGKETVDYTTKIMLAMLAFFTLIYHLQNTENQIKTQKESNRQNLAKYTYEICADFRKPSMMDCIETTRVLIKNQEKLFASKDKMKEFDNYLNDEKNSNERKSLVLIVNYFESVSAMALAGDLNDEIVKRLFGTLFTVYYKKLQYYIDYKQTLENPKSWVNFETLAKKWLENDKR